MTLCKGVTAAGKPCKSQHPRENGYCHAHQSQAQATPVVQSASLPAVEQLAREEERMDRGLDPSPLMELREMMEALNQTLMESVSMNARLARAMQENQATEREILFKRWEMEDRKREEADKALRESLDQVTALIRRVPEERKQAAERQAEAYTAAQEERIRNNAAVQQQTMVASLRQQVHVNLLVEDAEIAATGLRMGNIVIPLRLGANWVPKDVAEQYHWHVRQKQVLHRLSGAMSAQNAPNNAHVPAIQASIERELGMKASPGPHPGDSAHLYVLDTSAPREV